VFEPQAVPDDYLRRAAIALVLRPKAFFANARDLALLRSFIVAQVPRYAGLCSPTIIITGDCDTIVSPDINARALAAALPRAKLVLVKGVSPCRAGHRGSSDRRTDACALRLMQTAEMLAARAAVQRTFDDARHSPKHCLRLRRLNCGRPAGWIVAGQMMRNSASQPRVQVAEARRPCSQRRRRRCRSAHDSRK
jgi:hypothetical protein